MISPTKETSAFVSGDAQELALTSTSWQTLRFTTWSMRQCPTQVGMTVLSAPVDKLTMSLNDKRLWLWTMSFDEFLRTARATPLYDQSAQSFRELYMRNRAAGVPLGTAISMTLFTQQKDPSCVKIEELRWTIYVFCPGLEADEVLAMDREALCGTYHQLVATYPHPTCPSVRWKMGGETIDVAMGELDVADRSQTRLRGLYDHRNAQGFLSAEVQAQSEPRKKGVSMIISLIEAGGAEGPQQT
jgi:hypothetical protein